MMSEPCRFLLDSIGADGAPNKRLVQITSLRNRFTCEFGQGFGLTPFEVRVAYHVHSVPTGDDGVTPQILQRKDLPTAFRYRTV